MKMQGQTIYLKNRLERILGGFPSGRPELHHDFHQEMEVLDRVRSIQKKCSPPVFLPADGRLFGSAHLVFAAWCCGGKKLYTVIIEEKADSRKWSMQLCCSFRWLKSVLACGLGTCDRWTRRAFSDLFGSRKWIKWKSIVGQSGRTPFDWHPSWEDLEGGSGTTWLRERGWAEHGLALVPPKVFLVFFSALKFLRSFQGEVLLCLFSEAGQEPGMVASLGGRVGHAVDKAGTSF